MPRDPEEALGDDIDGGAVVAPSLELLDGRPWPRPRSVAAWRFTGHPVAEEDVASPRSRMRVPAPEMDVRFAAELAHDLCAGDHLGVVVPRAGPDLEWMRPLVSRGVEAGERVVLLAGRASPQRVREALGCAGSMERGAVGVVSAPDLFHRADRFDAEHVLALLDAEIEIARVNGYRGLRVVADMTWALDGLARPEALASYERRLHGLIRGRPCVAICHYDERLLSSAALPELLSCHCRWIGSAPRVH